MNISRNTVICFCAGLAFGEAAFAASPSAPSAPSAAKTSAAAPSALPAVQTSTKAAGPMSPTDLYTGDRLRDPFMDVGAGGGRGVVASESEPFSIHALVLRGVMKDGFGDFAILVQPNAGATYILRNGKLYDRKNKVVAGVVGRVNLKKKKVELETPDKDVQVLILGEQQEGI